METTIKGLGFSAQRGLGGLEGLRPVQVGCIFYRVYAVKGLGSAGFRVCGVHGFESKVWSPGGCSSRFGGLLLEKGNPVIYMSYSLKLLKGGYLGDYIGMKKVYTRSLDYIAHIPTVW